MKGSKGGEEKGPFWKKNKEESSSLSTEEGGKVKE